jgi:hypothetical protein
MSNLSLLHFLVAGGALGAVVALRREATGRSLTAGRLFVAPMLALLAAIMMLALAGPHGHTAALWIGGLATGLAVGAMRGIMVPLQVDRLWERLRLPHARDGLWASLILSALALVAVIIPDASIAAASAGCAGYLAGRGSSLWLRTLNAPHSDWRAL